MGKRLTDNLNSNYIGAANRLKPGHARTKIIAYVESYDDISFWRSLLGEFEDKTLCFEIMLPSRTSLAKGKKTALMNQLGQQLGGNMIACVDSDYDYLIQGRSPTSRYINESPYVLQTYAYAIENYHCYADGLHEVCVAATLNDHQLLDFEEYLRRYSNIIHPLFLWSVWFYRQHILNEFPLMQFCSFVKLDRFNVNQPTGSLIALQRKVNRKLRDLEHRHPESTDDVKRLAAELHDLGVTPDNTYMYIQGHHLKDNVVMRLLVPICTQLRKEREEEIQQLAMHRVQMQNELTNYERSQADVGEVIHRNTNYKNSPQYKMMQKDVQKLIKLIQSK